MAPHFLRRPTLRLDQCRDGLAADIEPVSPDGVHVLTLLDIKALAETLLTSV